MNFNLLFENKDIDNPLGYYQLTGSYDLNGSPSGSYTDVTIEGKEGAVVSDPDYSSTGVVQSFEIIY